MKILVTGATGFIGSYLVRRLAAQHEVIGLARRPPPPGGPVVWIAQDLAVGGEYRALPAQIDAVIHLAQSRFYRQFPQQAPDIFAVNVQSTFHLLEYARHAGARCFILASSGGVYGYSPRRCVETDPLHPDGFFYAGTKSAAEALISGYQSILHSVILRFFFVYGPGQQGMLIPTFRQKIRNGEPIVIDGDPGLRINPIHVEDAIRAFEPALHLTHSVVINIAGEEIVSMRDLVMRIAQVLGKEAVISHSETTRVGDLVGDATRMHELLGIHPHISLWEGLRSLDRTPSLPDTGR